MKEFILGNTNKVIETIKFLLFRFKVIKKVLFKFFNIYIYHKSSSFIEKRGLLFYERF